MCWLDDIHVSGPGITFLWQYAKNKPTLDFSRRSSLVISPIESTCGQMSCSAIAAVSSGGCLLIFSALVRRNVLRSLIDVAQLRLIKTKNTTCAKNVTNIHQEEIMTIFGVKYCWHIERRPKSTARQALTKARWLQRPWIIRILPRGCHGENISHSFFSCRYQWWRHDASSI